MVLKAGASKISMNSAAVNNPTVIKEASKDSAPKRSRSPSMHEGTLPCRRGFELVVSGGMKPVGKDAVAWAKVCQENGAGVILPTSMDGDGTLAGYDLEFTKAISDVVTVPVIASGGAGTLERRTPA